MKAALIATLTEAPEDDSLTLPGEVEVLEVRTDLVPEVGSGWLRDRFSGQLLYTLRSRHEGGECVDPPGQRRERLKQAAVDYDLVDLELERDLSSDLLMAVPPAKRIIAWHGPAREVAGLNGLLDRASEVEAKYVKLVPAASCPREALSPLTLLHRVRRRDVVAFAVGEAGMWTRPLAPRLGAPLVYGSVGDRAAAPGQPSIGQLMQDFGLPELLAVDSVFGIVGRPVSHSLSPRLHNAAYKEFRLAAIYLPFHAESFAEFWRDLVEAGALEALGFSLQGLSVTAPFKAEALQVADASSLLAEKVGAANTLVRGPGGWEADCTDPEGVVLALRRHGVVLAGSRTAVVGCGGAGRAAAVGLTEAGASVTMVNRSVEAGERTASGLGLEFCPLADFEPGDYRVVVQATPLGRRPADPLPLRVEQLAPESVVLDLVYGRQPTPLIEEVRARGGTGIDGREVLLNQALSQFRRMTGRELPVDTSRRLLGLGESLS
jgi:3-dehydroquinate dehydratase/shikimate dehydrogenase